MYPAMINEMKNAARAVLIVKTMSIPETFTKKMGLKGEELEEALQRRNGDISMGSTYLIDLEKKMSHRFRDHDRLMASSKFKGFFTYEKRLPLKDKVSLSDFKKIKSEFVIIEGKGELHDSTPIIDLAIVPSVVLDKALRDKTITTAQQLWNSLFK